VTADDLFGRAPVQSCRRRLQLVTTPDGVTPTTASWVHAKIAASSVRAAAGCAALITLIVASRADCQDVVGVTASSTTIRSESGKVWTSAPVVDLQHYRSGEHFHEVL
jgi:hypothetical protein